MADKKNFCGKCLHMLLAEMLPCRSRFTTANTHREQLRQHLERAAEQGKGDSSSSAEVAWSQVQYHHLVSICPHGIISKAHGPVFKGNHFPHQNRFIKTTPRPNVKITYTHTKSINLPIKLAKKSKSILRAQLTSA